MLTVLTSPVPRVVRPPLNVLFPSLFSHKKGSAGCRGAQRPAYPLQDGILNRGVGVQHPQKEKERALATSRGEIEPGPAVTLAAGITGSR